MEKFDGIQLSQDRRQWRSLSNMPINCTFRETQGFPLSELLCIQLAGCNTVYFLKKLSVGVLW